MKKMMIIGGMIGLLLSIGCGLVQGSSGASILWRSSIAALFCGYLFRWWGRVWLQALLQSRLEQLQQNAPSESGQTPVKI